MSFDAHAAKPSADVYYVGQLIGWCLTGTWPLQNVPLLPAEGPWRKVVRAATQHDAARRPQTIQEFKQLVEASFYRPPDPPEIHGQKLVDRLRESPEDKTAVDELLDLVEQNPNNEELCVDVLPQLTRAQLEDGIARHPERSGVVVEGLRMDRVDWGDRAFRWADNVIVALLAVAAAAADAGELDLLESAATALFEWDGRWDQWPPQGAIRNWLAGLTGAAAGVVAQALVDDPESARHFDEVSSNRRADPRIRDAIRRAVG